MNDTIAAGPSRPVPHTEDSSSSDSSVEPSEPESLGDIPLNEPEPELDAALDHDWDDQRDERMHSPPETPDDPNLVEMTDSDGQTGSRGVETAECWMRDSLAVIRRLILDRILGKKMRWAPEKHFTSRKRKSRRRGEIYTADWLWRLQGEIPDEFASIISVIVSSDETRLTNYAGDKKAHPVYATIGNIPKRLRRRISSRANVLIGYLPVVKLDCEPNADRKRELKRELFHRCIEDMLAPLTKACEEGGVEMPCADGEVRRIYPVLAAYVADFPEQCKVACVKQTHCPLCTTHPKTRGDPGHSGYRDRDQTLRIMNKEDKTGSAWFTRYGLLPTRPFWESHPHVDIGSFITPDLLHQVHKGVMKDHLIKWVTEILGKSAVDERYMSMPEAHGLRHFKSGISSVSQWTGRELKEMVKVLLPALSDSDPRVVRAARSLMDFMYLAHAGSLTDEDLDDMDDALCTFHNHKDVFKELGAVTTDKGFHGIPKLHMISHYTHLIRELGTPDGYNTETSERLHIDFAKMGYRASNKVNATKQMAMYIQRLEAIAMHASYLEGKQQGLERPDPDDEDADPDEEDAEFWDEWLEEDEDEDEVGVEAEVRRAEEEPEEEPEEPEEPEEQLEETHEPEEMDVDVSECIEWDVESDADRGELYYPSPEVVVAKTPTWKRVPADDIIRKHGATDMLPALRSHLARTAPRYQDLDFEDGQYRFDLWSRARFFHAPPPFKPSEGSSIDVVRAQPAKYDRYRRLSRPARYDTVFVLMRDNVVGLHRYRPARVRVIFQLPEQIRHVYPGHLVFVELFNYCSAGPVEPTGLFTTNHSNHEGRRVTAILPLSSIRMTCHLAPKYTAAEQNDYQSLRSDTLSTYSKFFINIYSSYFMYELVRHWGQDGMWRRDPDEDEEQVRDNVGVLQAGVEVEVEDEGDADANNREDEDEEGHEDHEDEEDEEDEEDGWGQDEDEDEDIEEEDDNAAYVPPRAPMRTQTIRLPRGRAPGRRAPPARGQAADRNRGRGRGRGRGRANAGRLAAPRGRRARARRA